MRLFALNLVEKTSQSGFVSFFLFQTKRHRNVSLVPYIIYACFCSYSWCYDVFLRWMPFVISIYVRLWLKEEKEKMFSKRFCINLEMDAPKSSPQMYDLCFFFSMSATKDCDALYGKNIRKISLSHIKENLLPLGIFSQCPLRSVAIESIIINSKCVYFASIWVCMHLSVSLGTEFMMMTIVVQKILSICCFPSFTLLQTVRM